MRVNDSNLNPVTTGARQTSQTDKVAPGKGSASGSHAGAASDQVQLSRLSSTLRASGEVDGKRQERVAQLAAAVQGGTYHVDSRQVSRSVIHDATESR